MPRDSSGEYLASFFNSDLQMIILKKQTKKTPEITCDVFVGKWLKSKSSWSVFRFRYFFSYQESFFIHIASGIYIPIHIPVAQYSNDFFGTTSLFGLWRRVTATV